MFVCNKSETVMNISFFSPESYSGIPTQAAQIHQYLREKFPGFTDKKTINTHMRNIKDSSVVMPNSKCVLINTWNYYYRSLVNNDLIIEYEGTTELPKRNVKIDTFHRKSTKSNKMNELLARIAELEAKFESTQEEE